jgi:hypothetical protein
MTELTIQFGLVTVTLHAINGRSIQLHENFGGDNCWKQQSDARKDGKLKMPGSNNILVCSLNLVGQEFQTLYGRIRALFNNAGIVD